MTNQEAFDKALFGLREQGVASYDECIARCKYRGPNRTKCAAGLLIPDELYNPAMDGENGSYNMSINAVIRDFHGVAVLLHRVSALLLRRLQDAHDSYMPREKGGSMFDWEHGMKMIAGEFGLEYKEPTK